MIRIDVERIIIMTFHHFDVMPFILAHTSLEQWSFISLSKRLTNLGWRLLRRPSEDEAWSGTFHSTTRHYQSGAFQVHIDFFTNAKRSLFS